MPTYQLLIVVAVAAFTIVIVTGAIAHARKAHAARVLALEQMGFAVRTKLTRDERREAFRALEPIKKSLPGGARGLLFSAAGRWEQREISFAVHQYQADKVTIIHSLAIARAPGSWPMLSVSPEGLRHRIAQMLGGKDIDVESPDFNRRFFVRCDDEDFAVLVLSPAVQAHMLAGDKHEHWRIGQGAIVLMRRAAMKPEDFGPFFGRLTALLAMLPPELEAYAPARAPQSPPAAT